MNKRKEIAALPRFVIRFTVTTLSDKTTHSLLRKPCVAISLLETVYRITVQIRVHVV